MPDEVVEAECRDRPVGEADPRGTKTRLPPTARRNAKRGSRDRQSVSGKRGRISWAKSAFQITGRRDKETGIKPRLGHHHLPKVERPRAPKRLHRVRKGKKRSPQGKEEAIDYAAACAGRITWQMYHQKWSRHAL
jgi:hypothetical protein